MTLLYEITGPELFKLTSNHKKFIGNNLPFSSEICSHVQEIAKSYFYRRPLFLTHQISNIRDGSSIVKVITLINHTTQ